MCLRFRLTPEQGGLGPVGHFKEVVKDLWPGKDNRKKFVWHPWADEMLEEAFRHNYLSVSGCANAGKSDFFAVFAIVSWLIDPVGTMVLITSTSLKESRGRIWGSVEEYWNAAPQLPGKLVSSLGLIRLEDPSEQVKTSDRSGIHLIAGEKRKVKDSIGKLIGLKNRRVILIADELPELSPALLEAAFSNLAANPFFQLIGIGNPASIYDPHGIFSKPKNGWKSVTPAHYQWETEKGYHIRFDAERSPNVLAGRTIYPFLPTRAKLDQAAKDLGPESLAYWRMWRSFWCPNGSAENIYSEADLIKFDADRREVQWASKPTDVAALDPGFTNGGDRSVLFYGKFGQTKEGKTVLLFDDYELLFEDATKKGQPRTYQIAEQFRDRCKAKGILPEHAAYDSTGAGNPFGDVVQEVWSKQVHRVQFGGNASMMPVSVADRTPACERYPDRVSEIWGSGQEYLKGGQLLGIGPDLGQEMTARKCVTVKREGKVMLKAEPKELMRARTGKSPDIADAAFILLDLCRTKFRFKAVAASSKTTRGNSTWKKVTRKLDVWSQSGNYLIDEAAA